jgi:hypothetical protein
MNVNDMKHALEMPFAANRLHWRVGATTQDKTKGIALAYLNARDVMRRLDEVFPMQWQNRYSLADNKLLVCEIGLKVEGEWLWRANGAGDSDIEAEKGKASDAFKRAAVMWGIGRYLYSMSNEWVPITEKGRSHVLVAPPTLPPWATPEGYKEIMLKRETQQ